MYKSVLVPIDLSHKERAAPMFDHARALCADGGAITVVHVVPAMPGYVTSAMPPGLTDTALQNAREELHALVADQGIDVKLIIKSGTPHHVVLETAEAIGTDLIVIASHDPKFSDFLLGSTAAKVVRHAHCSVMVLR